MSVIQKRAIYVSTASAMLDSNDDWFVPFTRSINNVKSISLLSFNIPWSWTNVTSTTNTIVFVEGNVTKTATLTIGQYSNTDFMTAVGIALTAASAGTNTYTVTSSDITRQLTIHSNNLVFTIKAATTTASYLIGLGSIDLTAVVSGSGGFDLTPTNRYDLLPVKELQIQLPGLIKGVNLAQSQIASSVIHLDSLSGYSYGQYMRCDELPNPFDIAPGTNMNGLTVSVVDQTGYTPGFDPNTPLSFLFEVIYRDAP